MSYDHWKTTEPDTGERKPEKVFRYVLHDDVDDYLARGWTLCADLGPPHGHYSRLMQAPDGEDD